MFRKLGSHVILKLLRVTVRRLSYAFALRWTHSEEGEGRQGAGQGAVRGAGSPQPLTRSQPQGGSDSWSLCPLPRCAAGLPATPAETSLFCRVLPARPGRGAKAAICKPGRGSWQGNATVSPGPWTSSLRNCEEQVTGKADRGRRLRRGTHRSPRRPCSQRTPQTAFGGPWPTVIRILFVVSHAGTYPWGSLECPPVPQQHRWPHTHHTTEPRRRCCSCGDRPADACHRPADARDRRVRCAVLPHPRTRGPAPGTLYVKGNKCQLVTRSG